MLASRTHSVLGAAFVLTLATSAAAQYPVADIRSLATADQVRSYNRFTARCVADNGECWVQSARFSTSIDVYASATDFMTSGAILRSVNLAGLAGTGGQLIWVNGTLYGAVAVGGGPLGHWTPTGMALPTALTAGSTSIAWGGGLVVLIGCDGNFIYVNKDSVLEIYDLAEVLQRAIPMPYTINTLSTGFAAGGHWYPVRYNGLSGACSITERIDAATGAVEPWSDTLAMGCPYLVSASYDYFGNRVLHTSGNPSTCTDQSFLYNDVVLPTIAVTTVTAVPAVVTAGTGGHVVGVDVENLTSNPFTVASVDLTFTDAGAVDVSSEYTVTPAPGNPTSIPAMSTASFSFDVAVMLGATTGTITLDAAASGMDAVTMAPLQDPAADTTDTWDVVACSAPNCGDCNGDLVLSILDALVAAQHAAAIITLSPLAFSNCNVFGALEPDPAAAVTILDALTLAQSAAALPVVLVCC